MKNQTYSRTSPKDGRRATLGANGKYSRKNNKGYIINQGIGNLNGTTGEVQLTNTNTGTVIDTNTGLGGFDTGGTNEVATYINDLNNDGYGEVGYPSGDRFTYSFNMIGEYTIDTTEFGTFAAVATAYPISVERLDVGQTTDLAYRPNFASPNGLADGTNGFVRFVSGVDSDIRNKGYRMSMMDVLTNEGVTFRSLQSSFNSTTLHETVYLANNTGSISVGDSIYEDATGTMLASGTTNDRPNRYWFMSPDISTGVPMVTKVTSGVVTHRYAWNTGVESYKNLSRPSAWRKQVYLGNNTYNNPPAQDISGTGQVWVGNESTGSMTTNTSFADAVIEAQTYLNDGYAIEHLTTPQAASNEVWLDFSEGNNPIAAGQYLSKYPHSAYDPYDRIVDGLEVIGQPLVYELTFPLNITIDETYKAGETHLRYLPLLGYMFRNFNLDDEGKAVIVIEYKWRTGEIVNSEIVAKNNGSANLHPRDANNEPIV